MIFRIEERLPNLNVNCTTHKVSSGLDYTVNDTGKVLEIKGNMFVEREIKIPSNEGMTEIKSHFPIDISVSKKKLKKGEQELRLIINAISFDFQEEFTVIKADVELNADALVSELKKEELREDEVFLDVID